MLIIVVVAVLMGLFVWGPLGRWVALQKGRDRLEGLTLGLIFGPFGVLIEALLPSDARTPERRAADQEAEDRRLAAANAQAAREARERHEAALERERRQLDYLAALPGRIWAGLGDVGQPIAIGLAVAVPLLLLAVLLIASRG